MHPSLFAYGLLAYLCTLVSSTALTYKLAPNEKACFYAWVDQPGSKMAFYFAVRVPLYFPGSIPSGLPIQAFPFLLSYRGVSKPLKLLPIPSAPSLAHDFIEL